MLSGNSLLSAATVLLSLSTLDLAQAVPVTSSSSIAPLPSDPPGRHAPPYISATLGSSKRALMSFLGLAKKSNGKVLARSNNDEGYYSSTLVAPPTSHGSSLVMQKRAVPTDIPSNWGYYGCVTESNNERLLQGFSYSSNQNTAGVCVSICAQMGFQFAGAEWGVECYCGNTFIGSGGQNVSDSDCSMPCGGDSSETCGNGGRLSMYQVGSAGTTGASTLPTASSTAAVSTAASGTNSASQPEPTYVDNEDESEWYSLGCAVDGGNNRILTGLQLLGQQGLSVDKCLVTCEEAGFKYAGVEFGQECYCGNTWARANIWVDDGTCDMPCNGNSSETCGGGDRIDLYELVYSAGGDCPEGTTSTAASTSAGNQPAANGQVFGVSGNVPRSDNTPEVYAHHMVGNVSG